MTNLRGFRKGLTMIEVLVSLMIFLVVLLAIYQLFDTSHTTYAAGTRKQDVQQQARLAMEEMVRVLRMAGYVSENYDATAGNEMTDTARIHVATDNFLAVFGNPDNSAYSVGPPITPASHVFVFCRDAAHNTLLSRRGTPTDAAATYTCDNTNTLDATGAAVKEVVSNVIADNVTRLQFRYFDENGARVGADGSGNQVNLDNKAAGGALDNLAVRAQRDAVRTIVITLEVTEPVIRQSNQVYTLTSTVRLRNLNNL